MLTGEEIVRRMEEKLGRSVPKFTVFSVLKNQNEFEKIGDDYRLKR